MRNSFAFVSIRVFPSHDNLTSYSYALRYLHEFNVRPVLNLCILKFKCFLNTLIDLSLPSDATE